MHRLCLPLLLALLLWPQVAPAAKAREIPEPERFPVAERLQGHVAFWSLVYGRFDSDQRLLHHRDYPSIVYRVLDFEALGASQASESRQAKIRRLEIQKAETHYRDLLRRLSRGEAAGRDPEMARLERLFRQVPGGAEKYREAMGRFRTQQGMRDRFAEGVERASCLLPHIRKVFRDEGLPEELALLPFVESMFHTRAHSSAQALGIWQFVASTGRHYLEISNEVDDRLDPLRASDAAARLLRDNYRRLGTWPLALTAYNYGANGLGRAVAQLGTRDLGVIVDRHRSRLFGFASKNFYAEFVAAVRTFDRRDELFPEARSLPVLAFDEFRPESWVHLPHLAEAAGVAIDPLRELNPSLSELVWQGSLLHPEGRSLRVPVGSADAFRRAFEALPLSAKADRQTGLYYVVRRGDTLGAIARRNGTTIPALQQANRLASAHRIRVGQRLFVPAAGSVAAATITHRVVAGENLSKIAARYGTTTAALQRLNDLASPDRLRPGQLLRVAEGGQRTHVVQSGETLAAIAARYRTTVEALRAANQIAGHLILPRQVLVIP